MPNLPDLLVPHLLAQSDIGGALYVGLWVMLAGILALAGLYVAVAVRRWTRRDEQAVEAFSLHELRAMRDREEISQHEFETLRAALLAEAQDRLRRTETRRDDSAPTNDQDETSNP